MVEPFMRCRDIELYILAIYIIAMNQLASSWSLLVVRVWDGKDRKNLFRKSLQFKEYCVLTLVEDYTHIFTLSYRNTPYKEIMYRYDMCNIN